MMSETSVAEDLVRIEGLMARAKGEVDAGHDVDLAQMDAGIREVCTRIVGLPPAEGRPFRARLLSLYDELGQLAEVIRGRIAELEANLGENTKRRQAASAYGGTPRQSARPKT